MLVLGLVMGVLIGVLLMIVGRWIVDGVRRAGNRRRLRRMERQRREPLPQLWALGQPRRRPPVAGQHGVSDFLDGPRQRPDFNPSAGPRDW
jgi:hypothetical protein